MPIKIETVQIGLEQSINQAVRRFNSKGGIHLNINDRKFTGALGKITGSVSEFNKSLEASNARVLAFGASVGIINGVQSAFANLVKSAMQVEKSMTEINVVMGLTNRQLEEFSSGLFKVAKNTAQSFGTVATAATELARQGLTMEETLKRTNDALILTRLTGLDAASAVSGLTAALNTFNKAGLDSTRILSKMAAVDVQFAVSTEDLIDGVSRAGAVANDAGVSFDQLLGAVTAAQQATARGGKVIGNSFKTIFTRVQRSSTIKRLEELGIAVRDIAGNTLPAITVLENLSKTYEGLTDTTKAAVAEQVGGVFQINILKAAIKDLSDENSILARATQIASQATDEAYKKNEILNRSMSALADQTGTVIKELTALAGNIAFSDNITTYLTLIRDNLSSLSDLLSKEDGESAGADFMKGALKGIGNVISGPGLVIGIGLFAKLFRTTFKFLAGSAKELLGIVSTTEQQRQIQQSIVGVLGENSNLQKRILSQEGNRAAQEKTILSILQAQSREQMKIAAAARSIAPAISRAGYGPSLSKIRSGGHVPNYVSPSERIAEKNGAKKGGYTAGSVKSMNVSGLGQIIYNSAEKIKKFPGMKQPAIIPPERSRAGKEYKNNFKNKHGFNPYANGGLIPNFASRKKSRWDSNYSQMSNEQRSIMDNLEQQAARERDIARSSLPSYLKSKSQKANLKNKAMVFGDLPDSMYEKALTMYYNPTSYYQRPGKVIPGQLFANTIIPNTMLQSLNTQRPGVIPNFAYKATPANVAAGLIYGKRRATGLSLNDGTDRTLSDVWHSFSASMRTKSELDSVRTLIHRKFLKNASPGFLKQVEDSLKLYGNNVPQTWSMGPKDGYLNGMVYDLNTKRAAVRNKRIKDLGDRKLQIPNFSAFSFDKNLNEQSLVRSLLSSTFDFPKKTGVFDPYSEEKRLLNNTDALKYLDKSSLQSILKTFIKNADANILEFKGSYTGIPINQYKSLFEGDSTYGMRNISSARKREILSSPGVLNSFYSYLTGKSSSININSGLNSSEKKFFRDKYGAVPAMKHSEDGFSKTRADNLSLLREDFFGTKGVRSKVRKNVKGMLGDPSRRSNLLSENKFMEFYGKSSSLDDRPKSNRMILGYDPEQWITKARPVGMQLAQLYKSFTPSKSASSMTGKSGYFGELSGRFRGDQLKTLKAVQETVMQNVNASQSSKYLDKFLPSLIPGQFEKMLDGVGPEEAERKLFKRSSRFFGQRDIVDDFFDKRRAKAFKRFGFADGFVPNFIPLRINASQKRSAAVSKSGHDGVIGMSELDNIIKNHLYKSVKYHPLKGGDPITYVGRHGVHKYKKGAPPPKGFDSWDDFDRTANVGRTRVLHIPSAGPGDKGYRRVHLDRIESVVHRGKKLLVDPNMAAAGLIPNFAKFRVKTQQFGGEDGPFGPPKQVQFSSFVGDKKFVKSQATEIDDPKRPGKTGLQVIFTGESDQALRGKGYGRQLYEFMARYAKKSGYTGLYGDMTTSKSAMRVIDSIAKKGKFKVEKNKDLKFSKDELEPEGNWGSDSWTYKMSNQGHVPNYALFSSKAKDILNSNPGYAGAVADAVSREASFGVTPKVVSAPSLKSSRNPGLAVVNKEQEGGSLAKARALHGGLNPNQKTSMPNYALDLGDVINVRRQAAGAVRAEGLNMMERSFMEARNSINLFSASTKRGAQYLNRIANSFGKTTNLIKEYNLKESARVGLMGKESLDRRQFAKQMFRAEALQSVAQKGGAVGALAAQFANQGPRELEKSLATAQALALKNISKGTNVEQNKETLRTLNALNRNLDTQAKQMMNMPLTTARAMDKALKAESKVRSQSRVFEERGKGFNKNEARKFYAQSFLESKGIQTQDKKEANKIIASMGTSARREFSSFMKEQGVLSSNKSLAMAGFRSGEFGGLVRGNAKPFLGKLDAFTKALQSGNTKLANNLEKQLRNDASSSARNLTAISTLQGATSAIRETVKQDQSRRRSESSASKARNNLASRETGVKGFGQRLLGSFQAGYLGQNISRGAGGGIANRAGRIGGFLKDPTKQFANGLKGFGGSVGLGASFILPALAGFLENKVSREDRATLKDGSYRVSDTGALPSTLVGAGMGAIFGLPGAIVGGAAGFISSMQKATLTIDEQIRMREKEISVTSQNIQAISNIQRMSSARAEAFGRGDTMSLDRIDSSINQMMSNITDPKILKRVAQSGGDPLTLSKIEKELSDQTAVATSIQNFGMALRTGNAGNAGVAISSIMAQNIRNGKTTESQVFSTLDAIKTSLETRTATGKQLDPETMKNLRATAEGRQGFTSTGTLAGGAIGVGAGIGAAALIGGSALLTALTGGLASPLLMASIGAGVGAYAGRQVETGGFFGIGGAQKELKEYTDLGLDDLAEFDKLVDAGVMSREAVDQMMALFKEGNVSFAEIIEEAKKNVENFQKTRDASDAIASQLFNVSQKFKTTIAESIKAMEIDRIRTSGNIQNRQARSNFAAQFMSGRNATEFLSNEESRIFQMQASLKARTQDRENVVSLLRGVMSKEKELDLTAPQLDAVRRAVNSQGPGALQSMVTSRQIDAQIETKINQDRASKIFEIAGLNARGEGSIQMPNDPGELKAYLGVGTLEEQRAAIETLVKNYESIVNQGGDLLVSFSKSIGPEQAKMLQEMLNQTYDKSDVLAESIAADKRNLELTNQINKIQSKIQGMLEDRSSSIGLFEARSDLSLMRAEGRASSNISKLEFQQSPIFRGMRTDEQEIKRQDSIQRKIFEEEKALKQSEMLSNFKRDALRLMSERDLINSLNKLGDTIKDELAPGGGETSRNNLIIPDGSKTNVSVNKGGGIPGISRPRAPSDYIAQLGDKQGAKKGAVEQAGEARKLQASILDSKRKSLDALEKAFNLFKEDKNKGIFQPLTSAGDKLLKKYVGGSLSEGGANMPDLLKESYKVYAAGPGSSMISEGVRNIDSSDYEKVRDRLPEAIKEQKELVAAQEAVLADADKGLEKLNSELKDINTELKAASKQSSTPNQSSKTVIDKSRQANEAVTQQIKTFDNININLTEKYDEKIKEGTSIQGINDELNNMLSTIPSSDKNYNKFKNLVDTLKVFGDKYQETINQLTNQEFLRQAQRDIENFEGSLKFGKYSSGTIDKFRNLNQLDVEAQAGASAFDRAVEQLGRQKQYEVLARDPSASSAEVAEARIMANQQSIGTPDQLEKFSSMIDERTEKLAALSEVRQSQGYQSQDPASIQAADSLKSSIETLDKSMQNLASQMSRTTRRDGGFMGEFFPNMTDGLKSGFANVKSDAEQIYTRLGQDLPMQLRDGLADAMGVALSGADSFGNAMKKVGIQLINHIQQAVLKSASSRVLSAFGEITGLGYNYGGMVTGGSGVRDDVPAMLTGGEYVIKKSSVDKYGVHFLNNLNQGILGGYKDGGAVGLSIGAPFAAKREEYEDTNEYGSVTRYKVTRGEIGINKNLSSYAIANDRVIQEYFKDKENILRQDQQTAAQEKYREKVKDYQKKLEKNAMLGMLYGMVGGAVIGKVADFARQKYRESDFGQKRFKERSEKQYKRDGYIDVPGNSATSIYKNPDDRVAAHDYYDALRRYEGPQIAASEMARTGQRGQVTQNQVILRNKGGGVPSVLTSGEYVMNPQSVKKYGSNVMNQLNTGTLPVQGGSGSGSVSNISHGDVNININVDSGGGVSSSMSDPTKSASFAKKVKAAVMDVIAKEQRTGGRLR